MKRIGYIDGRRVFLADNQVLSFGTGRDVPIWFNGAQLVVDCGTHGMVIAAKTTGIYGEISLNGPVGLGGTLTMGGEIVTVQPVHLAGDVIMHNLPTSDPHHVGQLWNSSGDVQVSLG